MTRELARRLALDEIAGDREGAAAEADERLLGRKRFPDEPDRFEDERDRLVRIGHTQPVDIGLGPHRLRDDGADVLDQLHVDAHPEHREHDVREHHGRVDAVGAHGLQRDLGAELGLPADLEQRVLLADLAVPRQRPSGLAHEPDRGSLDGLEASRSDEKWLH